MVSLGYIWLRGNKLESLPIELCSVRNIKVIHLEFNEIQTISDSIGQMITLKQLYPNGFKSMTNDYEL